MIALRTLEAERGSPSNGKTQMRELVNVGQVSRVGLAAAVLKTEGSRKWVCEFESHLVHHKIWKLRIVGLLQQVATLPSLKRLRRFESYSFRQV